MSDESTNEAPGPPPAEAQEQDKRFNDRLELIATIMLAIATVLTAWSAFESAKWSGVQAIRFSEASTNRDFATRAFTRAGQEIQVDIALFVDWVSALSEDSLSTPEDIAAFDAPTYEPEPGTLSGFLFERFRDEFKPAVDAWLDTDPVNNPDAPDTPFALPDYRVDAQEEAEGFQEIADQKGQDARDANQNSDNYVLTVVLFASVLFFAGISGKLSRRRNKVLALAFGAALLIGGVVIIATFPIEI